MLGTTILKNSKINKIYYLNLARQISKSLKLDKNSTMFIFGSITNKLVNYKKDKVKQTRYLNHKGDLSFVKFEKCKIYPDLDLRIITTKNTTSLRNRAKLLIKDIKSEVLIEIKIDNHTYPFKDIKNEKITSFFRRVFVCSNVICLHNQEMLERIICLSKKHVTATDYLYDNQRKEIYLMAKNKLKKGNNISLDSCDLLKYPIYFNKEIIENERHLRNNSILITNNVGGSLWNEKIIKL